jgi:hypothetical protein
MAQCFWVVQMIEPCRLDPIDPLLTPVAGVARAEIRQKAALSASMNR